MTILNEDCTSTDPAVRKTDPFALVLFGATGDLARRKLIPAFYSLVVQGLLTGPFAVVAFARREGNDETFRQAARASIQEFAPDLPSEGPAWEGFASRLFYHHAEIDDAKGYKALGRRLDKLDVDMGLQGNRLFYGAIPPEHFTLVAQHLGKAGVVQPYSSEPGAPWSRIIAEKPFGCDLDSARHVNADIRKYFSEEQIFRIDHYLGKETVQNILVMRFANKLYEPLWNGTVIDNVQITVSETLGMEGRGPYFDNAGITRDVIQNHALQILTLVAMEPPVNLSADSIRDEKVKVLRSLRPFTPESVRADTIRGQYTAGNMQNGSGESDIIDGYTREKGVRPDSSTETYAALRCHVDNWRWAGVPFYIRAGKRLPIRATEVTIELKAMPDILFARMACTTVHPNLLTLRIQPHEGVAIRMSAKEPGPTMQIEPVQMLFDYADEFRRAIPDAYERLILDAILGEAALFARADEVEAAWSQITPILREWETLPDGPEPYFAGTWGPRGGDELLRADGRRWHNPGPRINREG